MSAVLAVVLTILKVIGILLLALLLLLLLALLLPAGIDFRWSHAGGLRLRLCYGPLHLTLYPRKPDEPEEEKAAPKTEPDRQAPRQPTPQPKAAEVKTAETKTAETQPPPTQKEAAPQNPPPEKQETQPQTPQTPQKPEQPPKAEQPKPKQEKAPPKEPAKPAAEEEEDTGAADRIKDALRADPIGYVRHLFDVLHACAGPLLWSFRVSKLRVYWTVTGWDAAATAVLYGKTLTTLNTILAIAQDHIRIEADQLRLEADYIGNAKQQRVVSFRLLICPLLALITVVRFAWRAWHDPRLLPPKQPKNNTPETQQGGNL